MYNWLIVSSYVSAAAVRLQMTTFRLMSEFEFLTCFLIVLINSVIRIPIISHFLEIVRLILKLVRSQGWIRPCSHVLYGACCSKYSANLELIRLIEINQSIQSRPAVRGLLAVTRK